MVVGCLFLLRIFKFCLGVQALFIYTVFRSVLSGIKLKPKLAGWPFSTNVVIKRNLWELKVKRLRRLSVNCHNPSTPMADQDGISPYNINTMSSRQLTRKKNLSIRRLFTDLNQVLRPNIIRVGLQTVERINNKILGVKASNPNSRQLQLVESSQLKTDW